MTSSVMLSGYTALDCDNDLSRYHKRVHSNGLIDTKLQEAIVAKESPCGGFGSIGTAGVSGGDIDNALLRDLQAQIPRMLRAMAARRSLPAKAVTTIRALVKSQPRTEADGALKGR